MPNHRVIVVLTFALAAPIAASAQNPASNKAFFASNTTKITIADATTPAAEVVLFDIPAALKTSSQGAVSAILSMEASLWTYNLTTAIVNGGKNSSSSRAAIKVKIEIDGQEMEPGWVVYADRLQATGLTINLACGTSDPLITCDVTGDATIELFQRTKNANSFTYFAGPLAPIVHSLKVTARGFIECRDNAGAPINCPSGTLAGYDNASTMAVIGKATMLLEEHNNWGSQ